MGRLFFKTVAAMIDMEGNINSNLPTRRPWNIFKEEDKSLPHNAHSAKV
jgi:hypothetical protein